MKNIHVIKNINILNHDLVKKHLSDYKNYKNKFVLYPSVSFYKFFFKRVLNYLYIFSIKINLRVIFQTIRLCL